MIWRLKPLCLNEKQNRNKTSKYLICPVVKGYMHSVKYSMSLGNFTNS